ncbi:MAG: nucleotidyltransferase family protein [Zoogloeaceae bacterium]|jgi:MurNAc alpha-1-phosphate uridylyltransferase|nr:nucleotidyltransferase family protein [Zoogloeaceae bacterium]
MRAMILAAGRGERMRPLTDHTPKPLLEVGGKPLIVWHLERLAAAGFREIVINIAHLGEQIPARLGDGDAWKLRITYSPEPPGALETAGGIARALPHLGNAPFLVVNGDIFCNWNPARARTVTMARNLAHLVLVENPPHHPNGDFTLEGNRPGLPHPGEETLTFAGIGIYAPQFFAGLNPKQPAKLAPLLYAAAEREQISGERHDGDWQDVGTPERLQALAAALEAGRSGSPRPCG